MVQLLRLLGVTDLRSIDIHSLLPQQEPFVMVGALTHYDDKTVRTETVIAADNLLVDGGSMSVAGMLENIAQTCAARTGYISKYILHRDDIKPGVIAAVDRLKVSRRPNVGETITTEIRLAAAYLGMTMFDADISAGGETLLTTSMKLKE